MADPVLQQEPGTTVIDALSQSSNPITPRGNGEVVLTASTIAQEEARQRALLENQPKRDPNASLWSKFTGKDIIPDEQVLSPAPKPNTPELVTPVRQEEPAPQPHQPPQDAEWIRNLRRENTDKGKEIKALQEKISDYDTVRTQRDDAVKRLEELRKVAEGHEKIASVAALEQSDDFQEKFVRGEDSLVESLKTISTENGIDAEAVIAALNNPNKTERAQQIASLYSQMNEFNRDEFRQTFKNIDNLRANKSRALADAKTELQQSVARRRQEENERNTAKIRESRDAWLSASLHAAELGIDDKTLREAEAFWNGARDRNKSALTILKGFAYDAKDVRIKELEDVLKQYQGATPGLRIGTTAPTLASNGEVNDLQSAMAKLRSGGYASTHL